MRKIFIYIYDLYNLLIQIFNKNLFVYFFNLRNLLGITKGRIAFKNNLYYLDNDYKDVYFSQKKLGIMFYSQGLLSRSQKLSEKYFLNEIVFEDDDVVIDCGANYGDMYLYFEINKFKVNYFAFEPSPEEFEILKLNTSLKIKTIQTALSNKKEKLNFYVKSDNGDSSLIKPPKFNSIIKVQTDTLNNLFEKYEKIKLLKVEAEGGEIEVINGADKILKNIQYISGDFGYERGAEQSETFSKVKYMLEKNNFELIKSTPRLNALFQNKSFV